VHERPGSMEKMRFCYSVLVSRKTIGRLFGSLAPHTTLELERRAYLERVIESLSSFNIISLSTCQKEGYMEISV